MPSTDSGPPASYVPCHFASGTFPVSRNYNLRQMLYNYSYSRGRVDLKGDSSHQVIPSFPFSDVPVYADTVDIETLSFHDYWGCLLTPDNVAARICTDDLRYHVWVATKRVVESGLIKLTDKEALIRAVMNQFMVELGLVLLDLCPGPLLLFVDPRLHDDSKQMVSRAVAMVAKFDEAQVRRWRIIVTLPATEEGMRAARELIYRHGIQTHLSLVSCLAHVAACIEAGAGTVSMSVEPIMEWFEQQQSGTTTNRTERVTHDHPGIEAIQACATFIRRRGLNTTLLTTDVRKWAELKQLSGISATALTKPQLDQIPMQHMVTWYPRPDDTSFDTSPATLHTLATPYPSHYLDSKKGFLAMLPAKSRSMVSAVLYVRLQRMADRMVTIEKVVWYEIKRRVWLEKVPLERLYRRPASISVSVSSASHAEPNGTETRGRRRSTSSSTSSGRPSKSRNKDNTEERIVKDSVTMIEGVDYF